MEDRIYVGQCAKIELETGCNLNDASNLRIYYEKPNGGASGYWAATKSGSANSCMYYQITSSAILDTEGNWKFWAYFTTSNGAQYGVPTLCYIYTPGQL